VLTEYDLVGEVGVADAYLDGVGIVVDVLHVHRDVLVRKHDIPSLVERHRECEPLLRLLVQRHVLPERGELLAYYNEDKVHSLIYYTYTPLMHYLLRGSRGISVSLLNE
jgi:hypothetical protein